MLMIADAESWEAKLARAAYEPLRPLPAKRLLEGCPLSQAGWSTGNEPFWYILACNVGREEAAAEAIREMVKDGGPPVEVFMPIERFKRCVGRGRNRRKVDDQRAYFAGYFFVKCALDAYVWRRIKGCNHVGDFVSGSPGALPSRVPKGLVEELIVKQLAGHFDRKPPPPFAKGERLMITEGPFAGLVGEFTGLDRRARVCLLLRTMGSAIPVSLKMAGVDRAV